MGARSKREQYWRDLIAEQEASGQSAAAWCRERELSPKRLYWWRSRLRRRDQEVADVEPAFLPVHVRRGPAGIAAAAGALLVRVGGREIVVDGEFDERVLARLVLLLETLPC